MENVIAFNNELSGLYDTKPPISKAKMAAITKAAMRAIKFYKHVVQSVEKFILKCKPEYKVPGLYVIDSIVRQSRHQFGPEKDVFAPRFARNIKETFANLFRCAPEDKSRIIRVLNLWQKNNVFAPEVIQPIFDLADPNHPIYNMPPAGISGSGNVGVMGTNSGGALSGATTGSSSIAIAGTGGLNDMTATAANGLNNSSGIGGSAMGINVTNIDMIMSSGTSSTHLQAPPINEDKLQNASLADLSSAGQSDNSHKSRNNLNINLRQQETHNKVQYSTRRSSNNSCDNMGVSNTVLPLPVPLAGSTSNNSAKTRENNKFGFEAPASDVTSSTTKIHHPDTYNKYQRNLHDFEYEDSTTATNHRDNKDDNDDSSIECESPKNTSGSNLLDNNNLKQLLNDPNVLRQLQTLQNFQKFKQEDKQHNLRMQEEAFEKHIQNVLKANVTNSSNQDPNDFSKEVEFVSEEQKIEVINLDGNDSRSPTPDRDRYKRRRSRSRSRSRERSTRRGRRSRSRTRSRTRSPRGNRRRTSRDRDRDRERINRDKERDREHERERRKRGLPDTRKEHLSVCSTTLWVGHLSKLVYQEELSDTFGEFGDIVSIDQIVPRGCAFIVMNRRQDAYKAMQSLKNHKLQGRAITISWAAGKGVKSKEWKDFWDLDLGVTYIPWHKLDEATDFDSLEEGGMFDEDSMPGWMKDKINKMKSIREKAAEASAASATDALVGPGPPPNTVPPGANPSMMFNIDTSQPPPGPPGQGGHPPPLISMVPGQFSMAPPLGAPSRMLAPPMGMPISGIHMPPNIVQPHAAMMMMPRFGCMPGQMGGPNTAPHMGPPLIPPIGNAPPSTSHYTGPPPATPIATGPVNSNITATMNTTDDQMDIEMEDEEGSVAAPTNQASSSSGEHALHFNHPPPAINTSHALPAAPGDIISNTGIVAVGEMGNNGNDIFTRDRNRGVSSRWGGRGGGGGGANHEEARWREDGISVGASSSYQGGRPVPPDFMNDNRGRIGPNFNGGGNDFHPNISNRFQLPASLMQMRIPPPSAFNSRGPGGPPMFMRGQGGPGGRLQGPGPGFYNRNNPFERDSNPFAVRGAGGRGGRGGVNRGRHNWNDEEIEDCGSPFKRRIGGMGLNRFRDRNEMVTDDRHNSRGGRRGGGNSRERHDNEQRDRDFRSHGAIFNRRDSSDDTQHEDQKTSANCTMSDTEDDWDQELQEYESKNEKNDKEDTRNCKAIITDVTVVISGNDSTQCVVKNDSKFNEVEEEEEEEYRLEPSTSTEELNADILTPISSFGSKNFEEPNSEPAMCDELPSAEFAESSEEPVIAEALSTSANTLTKMAAEEEEAESLTVAGEVDNTNDTEV